MENEYAIRDTRIITLQSQLLDYTGHVRKGLPRDETKTLIREINHLRAHNGWSQLDMTGRWFPRGLSSASELGTRGPRFPESYDQRGV